MSINITHLHNPRDPDEIGPLQELQARPVIPLVEASDFLKQKQIINHSTQKITHPD